MIYDGKKQNGIKAGTIFYVSSGSYSDYRVDGVYRVLKDITDPDGLVAQYTETKPEKMWDGSYRNYTYFRQEKMFAELIALGMIEQIEAREWWVGDGY